MLKENITEVITPKLNELGVSLYDLELEQVGSDYFLRIYIDHEEGVDLDLCVHVSEQLSPILDEADLIEEEYYLEVASPGAERPLKTNQQITDAIGKYIYVKSNEAIELSKNESVNEVTGYLTTFDNEIVTMELNIKGRIKVVQIPLTNITKIRLAIKF